MSGTYGYSDSAPPQGGGGYGRGGGFGGSPHHRGGGGGGGRGRGRGYGGDRDSRGGGGGSGGGGNRDGDWLCPNPSCGNLNFARRVECNKCGTPSLSSGGGGGYKKGGRDYGSGGGEISRGGGGDYDGFGGRGGGGHSGYNSGGRGYDGNRGGRAGNYTGRGGFYNDNQGRESGGYDSLGREDTGYGPIPPPVAASYGGPVGNYPSVGISYGRGSGYGGVDPVSPPSSYGGPSALPPTYGAPPPNPYSGDVSVGHGGPPVSYDGGYGAPAIPGRGGVAVLPPYGSAPVESPAKVKQCDENCGDLCDNSRIYISNLPPDVTTDELRDLFGGIGQVGRIKQKRGYKDQWPWNIQIYSDESGNSKGDACLAYEDPSAAHAAGGFYNNYDMRGHQINVAMAEKSAPRAPAAYGRGSGRGGGYGGGDRHRDNYRDAGGSGPDRHYHGGQRSRPY